MNGFALCRRSTCKACADSPQSAIVHQECLFVFVQRSLLKISQAFDHIRTIALFRKPWEKKPYLLHPRFYERANIRPSKQVAAEFDVALLFKFPSEVLKLIKDMSPHALIWRSMSAIAVADQILPTQSAQFFSLISIRKWTRGSERPEFAHDQHSVVKITIDSRGIRAIEQLQERPSFRFTESGLEHYVVEEAGQLRDVQVCMKVKHLYISIKASLQPNLRQNGLLQLKSIPESASLWNIPFPPRLADCCFATTLSQESQPRFQVIDFKTSHGLTFLYSCGRVYHVHVHNTSRDHATSSYEGFTARYQRTIVWVFCPISSSDKVLSIAVRRQREGSQNIMVCSSI